MVVIHEPILSVYPSLRQCEWFLRLENSGLENWNTD